MNYIDILADAIWRLTGGRNQAIGGDMLLYRFYALLALTKGQQTTNEDVHNAWAAWKAQIGPKHHKSLIPFDQLTVEVQDLDTPYRDAIQGVARRLLSNPV